MAPVELTTFLPVTDDPLTPPCGVSITSVSRWFQLVEELPKQPWNAMNSPNASTPTITPTRPQRNP